MEDETIDEKQTQTTGLAISLDYKDINYSYLQKDNESEKDFKVRVQADLDKHKVPILCH